MNVKLLRKIAKHISEEPKRFAMVTWLQKKGIESDAVTDLGVNGLAHHHPFPTCGTAACIGGWALMLDGQKIPKYGVAETAAALLDISEDGSERLFSAYSWPERFYQKFRRSRSARARAKVAIARIEHFIKTKGAE